MAYIKDRKKNLRTVGDVIDALSQFERDMPVNGGLDPAIEVYREEPTDNEYYDDDRGAIYIGGCDPDDWDDDEEE